MTTPVNPSENLPAPPATAEPPQPENPGAGHDEATAAPKKGKRWWQQLLLGILALSLLGVGIYYGWRWTSDLIGGKKPSTIVVEETAPPPVPPAAPTIEPPPMVAALAPAAKADMEVFYKEVSGVNNRCVTVTLNGVPAQTDCAPLK